MLDDIAELVLDVLGFGRGEQAEDRSLRRRLVLLVGFLVLVGVLIGYSEFIA